ncbi:MAG TPA: DUF1415 domain-containing protein, partial [Gammaproteobacteria bacterium]|nr:DUF1415 domain-containing protein [Gammaproteobacteria bacterium]
TVIVGHNFCPFAKAVLDADRVHVAVIENSDFETCLEKLVLECERLDNDPAIETTLVVFPQAANNFDDFLDFIDLAEQLMATLGYEGVYQLAHFHPDYQFEGLTPEDPANYTNRSPYPTLHLIREASLEKALENYPQPEKIPERNIEYARKLGMETLAKQLASCRDD